ncbi:MAG TPA: sigma-70 family RNA polymerase sigma factor [Phycisphaerales bacterium]|jgi:RNA polymerase sigma-70 factor (ECF subfamily)|nr:sigma-70 family RNA polymerase sigma factor [Phycisphaerales bacterium]
MGAVDRPNSSIAPSTARLDGEAFARTYQQHWRMLWCAAVAVLGDRVLAQDVVQQAAVVGLQRLDQFDPSTSFAAWMIQIVRNIALNESRKRTRRRTAAVDPVSLDSGPASRSGQDEHGWVLTGRGQLAEGAEPFDDELMRALGELDEMPRGCLLLRVVLDMPYRDISLALNIPEGTAASHVHRARAALRRSLRSSPSPSGNGGMP